MSVTTGSNIHCAFGAQAFQLNPSSEQHVAVWNEITSRYTQYCMGTRNTASLDFMSLYANTTVQYLLITQLTVILRLVAASGLSNNTTNTDSIGIGAIML